MRLDLSEVVFIAKPCAFNRNECIVGRSGGFGEMVVSLSWGAGNAFFRFLDDCAQLVLTDFFYSLEQTFQCSVVEGVKVCLS